MESGADWSSRVDHEAGQQSHVIVVAKKSGESVEEFETRVRLRLDSIGQFAAADLRGILVFGRASKLTLAARAGAGRALFEMLRRAGGGEVVIVGDDQPRLATELETFAQKLNQRQRSGGTVTLRFRPETSASAVRRVA
jgi:hypothetical protein